MTHREDTQRIAELNSLFLTLNEKGQESALTVLRALEFAQSVMSTEADELTAESCHCRTGEVGRERKNSEKGDEYDRH